MKKLLFIILVVFMICRMDVESQIIGGGSQSEEVQYTYDNAGNRITRSIITVFSIFGNDEPEIESKSEAETDKSQSQSDLDKRESEVFVYPNPVKEELTVEIWKGAEKASYRLLLFDMQGKALKEDKQTGNGRLLFDMSVFPNGTYLLIVEGGGGKKEFKIVKE
jgi:hypothetical protein